MGSSRILNEQFQLIAKKHNFIFLIILVTALSLRILIWSSFFGRDNTFVQIDTMSYLKPGIEIFENSSFSSSERTPVYPLFLGAVSKFISNKYSDIALIQVAMSMLSIFITYILCLKIFNSYIALISSFLMSIDIPSIFTASFLLTETFFTLIILLSLFFLFFSYTSQDRAGSILYISLSGIVFSVATLCRPIAIFLFIPVTLWIFFSFKKHVTYTILYFIVSSVIFPAFWMTRNHIHTGKFFISTISSKSLFVYRAAWVESRVKNRGLYDIQEEFREISARHGERYHLNPGELAEWEKEEGLKILKEHPLLVTEQGIEGFAKMYLFPSLKEVSLIYKDNDKQYNNLVSVLNDMNISSVRKLPVLSTVIIILMFTCNFFMYAGVLVSVYTFFRKRNIFICLNIIFICYFTLFSIGAEAYSRFRVPIIPMLAMLGASGLVSLLKYNDTTTMTAEGQTLLS